jgi:hypothetical protein
MVERLETADMVRTFDTDLGTLFTLKNFNVYQDPERYRLDLGTDLGTPAEHLRNNRKKHNKDKNLTAPEKSVDFVELSEEAKRLGDLAGQHLQLTGEPTDQDISIIEMWLRKGLAPDSIERAIVDPIELRQTVSQEPQKAEPPTRRNAPRAR